jgi:hypothetical protein
MTTDRQAERDAIQPAIARLLAGTPTRSTGAHRPATGRRGRRQTLGAHPQEPRPEKEFEDKRKHANGIPAAYQSLNPHVTDLRAANERLREENCELRQRVDVYAQVIYELASEIQRLQSADSLPDNVRVMQRRSPLDTAPR